MLKIEIYPNWMTKFPGFAKHHTSLYFLFRVDVPIYQASLGNIYVRIFFQTNSVIYVIEKMYNVY